MLQRPIVGGAYRDAQNQQRNQRQNSMVVRRGKHV
jgi:hypothetical protein